MSVPVNEPLPLGRRRGPVGVLIRLFSSVWFGIAMMILIFLYMTVASAGIVVPTGLNLLSADTWTYVLPRKHAWLDMTEMEIFAWWPFTLLIAAFVMNMVVVTLRRIPLTILSLGVWMIHTGIVILAIGSVIYFRGKLEGDTPVFRRHIVISLPDQAGEERLVVRPQNRAMLSTPAGPYEFVIQDIEPAWPILSGNDKGKTACSVNVAVRTPTQSFVRQMLIGYPQYTEDIIPGQGRAIKAIGRKLVDEKLSMHFAYEPQTHFYLRESAALFIRPVGAKEWIERPIEGLPHYSDHITDRTEIWQPAGQPIDPDPLDLSVTAAADDDPMPDVDIHVTGRLHYAPRDEVRWVPGGSRLNPVVSLRLDEPNGAEHLQLAAFDRRQQFAADGLIAFRWADDANEVASFAAEVGGRLEVTVADTGQSFVLPVTAPDRSAEAPAQPIGNSQWQYRFLRTENRVPREDGSFLSAALVEFIDGERTIRRWVTNDPSRAGDVIEGQKGVDPPDPALAATYHGGVLVMLIGEGGAAPGAPVSLTMVLGDPQNRTPIAPGEPVALGGPISMTVTELIPRGRQERRPVVVSKRERDPQAGNVFSRVKLTLSRDGWSESRWVDYHRYPLPNAQYAVPRRFKYNPSVFTLPDGRRIEMILSRKRWPLPAALALEDFELKTHVGGFVPGQTASIRDFISVLRAFRDGTWSEPFQCSLNNPGSEGGMYYFQSEWDPGQMAFTGLGVGNRQGVITQLVGTCIAVLGMIYVFYIKPLIKRRRRQRVWSQVEAEREVADVATEAATVSS